MTVTTAQTDEVCITVRSLIDGRCEKISKPNTRVRGGGVGIVEGDWKKLKILMTEVTIVPRRAFS